MKYLLTDEVALRLGVTSNRIRAKIANGQFPGVKKCPCGQANLIPESDLVLASIDRRTIKKHMKR